MNTLIVGLQYGDEGKGRVAEFCARSHDWCIRFNGGPNAGHTVYDPSGKKHAFHHLPAGVVHGKKIALDTGMVIDGAKLVKEIKDSGMDKSNLYISENVHLITEDHLEQDKDGSKLGTTRSGIAYVYADRALKIGPRISNLIKNDRHFNAHYYRGLPPIEPNESVLLESAQGIMLDVDYGCYPYVTSSSVFPSSLYNIDHKIGVMKAYTSRVGDGPPYGPQVPHLGTKGTEIGTTTGRPRKCYWNNIDELKYAVELYRPHEIVVTKLDILEDEYIYVIYDELLYGIGKLDSYIDYLVSLFPQINLLSFSPFGDFRSV